MYNSSKTYQSRALNYFHIFIAIITFLYFVVSFFINPAEVSAESIKAQKYSRYFLLLALAIDLILAVYIRLAREKPLVFFQALSAMLLLSAHVMFIYAFFAFDQGAINTQSAIDSGLILLLVSCLLHVANFWASDSDEDDSPNKIEVDDALFEHHHYDE